MKPLFSSGCIKDFLISENFSFLLKSQKKNPVDAQINDLTLFYGDLRQSEKLFKINLPLGLLSMVKITYLMITKTEFQICL